MTTSPTYIFIQYRKEMVMDDHSVIWAKFFDIVEGEVQIDITDQMAAFPAEPDAEIQQTSNEQRADVLLAPIRALIPLYNVEPRAVFATFAHNINSEIHHPYDYLEARKFLKKFQLDPENVVIVEFGVDSSGNVFRANGGCEQPFLVYFQEDIAQAAR